MRNLFAALMLGLILAGVSSAQAGGQGVKIAVVEFTHGATASTMSVEGKRNLQAGIAAALNHTRKFNVYDTRHTRTASTANLEAVNGQGTAAAAKLGKQLGVAYVVTGVVPVYDTSGSATVRYRVVEVATGKIKHSGEVKHRAPLAGSGSDAQMRAKVLKPIIDELTESMVAAF